MIVNEREALSRAMYWELKRKAPPDVPVYQQAPFQSDVWEELDGDKDDFLVYDRCGLLTYHVVLPYSFLHYPYVEAAIRATYHKNICNCSINNNSITTNETAQLSVNEPTTSPTSQLETDEPEEEITAPRSTHHHNLHHHHPHHHHHTTHQNQSHHQQDTNQNKTQNLPSPHHSHDHAHPPHHH